MPRASVSDALGFPRFDAQGGAWGSLISSRQGYTCSAGAPAAIDSKPTNCACCWQHLPTR